MKQKNYIVIEYIWKSYMIMALLFVLFIIFNLKKEKQERNV